MPVCRLARDDASPSPTSPHRPRRYPSDTTDAEWALLEPLLPPPASGHGHGGRPEAHHRRDIIDAIRYVAHNGCVWRALPADFPPWRTVYGFYWRWNASGATATLHDQLRAQARMAAGRTPCPSAAIIDSQSVRAADTVPRSSRGFDAAKKITAANATWRSTPWGYCWRSWSPRPVSKTATAPGRCCGGCALVAAASCWCGPMPPTRATWSSGRPLCACVSNWSVGAWRTPSRCCRAAG